MKNEITDKKRGKIHLERKMVDCYAPAHVPVFITISVIKDS